MSNKIHNDKEKWHILDFQGTDYENYSVSNHGRVMNNKTGKILKPIKIPSGYLTIVLYNKNAESIRNSGKKFMIHRLVGLYFVKGDTSLIINHIDGDKEHCHWSNLEWCTYSKNLSHAFKTGLRSQDGVKNPSNVYSEKTIRKICSILEKGNYRSYPQISFRIFGDKEIRHVNLIKLIKYRKNWTSISKDYNF